MIIGVSHHFFLVLKKLQNSLRIESFAILRPFPITAANSFGADA